MSCLPFGRHCSRSTERGVSTGPGLQHGYQECGCPSMMLHKINLKKNRILNAKSKFNANLISIEYIIDLAFRILSELLDQI